MRWLPLTLTALGFAAMVIMAVLPGCEEVLEACPPCGNLTDGNSTFTDEPRLDHSFEALQRIRTQIARNRERLSRAISALSSAFDLSDEDSGDLSILASNISLVIENRDVQIQYPKCRVSRDLAVAFQQQCESRVCAIPPSKDAVYCSGLLSGSCDAESEEGCFTSDTECSEGRCFGYCEGDASCPGWCEGNCQDGVCEGMDPEECDGYCTGTCSGLCYSDTPYECDGVCSSCERADSSACTAPDYFVGYCEGASTHGDCLGNLYPVGCSESCPGCDDDTCKSCDGVAGCRETAKFVAWSMLQCDSTTISIVNKMDVIVDDNMSLERLTIEKHLEPILNDYAWLSLLVNGEPLDDTGEPADRLNQNSSTLTLDDGTFRYQDNMPEDLPVDQSRLAFPLENMKAHFYWLQSTALDSEAGFQIAYGAYKCAAEALTETQSILSEMVPTVEVTKDDGDIYYEADDKCTTDEDETQGTSACLYELLADYSQLLTPILSK